MADPPPPAAADFLDYIFKFPSQGAFQGDPIIQQFAPGTLGSQGGVQLLIYNPVETLTSPAASRNALVFPPQQANSSVALSGFWAMITLQGFPGPGNLTGHPNLQILNDRTLMFARQPSVISSLIDISHINIVINIYGVYVADGLKFAAFSGGYITEDGLNFYVAENGIDPYVPEFATVAALLLEDAASILLLETGGDVLLEE